MEPSEAQAQPPIDDNGLPVESSGTRRAVNVVLLVLTVGIAAYMLAGRPTPGDATNLVGLVGTVEIDPLPLLRTSVAGDIEDVLRAELGYHLLVPSIIGAKIVGVGIWDADRSVRIPVVSYDDPQGDIRSALVLNYAILDEMSGAVFLDRSIRSELEQDKSYAVVGATDNREVILWRDGDDIFVAVAEKGAGRLIKRISQSGSGVQG